MTVDNPLVEGAPIEQMDQNLVLRARAGAGSAVADESVAQCGQRGHMCGMPAPRPPDRALGGPGSMRGAHAGMGGRNGNEAG